VSNDPIRLSAQDAAFMYGEDQRIPLHVGSLGIMEAAPLRDDSGAIDLPRLRRNIENRLELVPMFRKKFAEVPFDQGRPVWVDDPDFRIENHVHCVALPKPGGRQQLLELMGRVQSTVLDRTASLWELYFVDGLDDENRVAIIARIHHAMIDGTSGVELASILFDLTPEITQVEKQDRGPISEPSPARLLVGAWWDRARNAVQNAEAIAGAIRNPAKPATHALKFARSMGTMATEFDKLPFNAPVGSRRVFATAQVPLEGVLAARRALGVKVNDIALAAVTGALRRYCLAHDIDPDSLTRIKALCPVDNRVEGDTHMGTDVSSMIVELPINEPDRARRVEQVALCSKQLKSQDVADGANMWARVLGQLPIPLLRVASRMQFRGLMSQANVLVSNVRGPAQAFYCNGAKVFAFYPYFGVQDGLGLNVVLVSYAGQLQVGVAADAALVPDVDEFAESLGKELEELSSAV
jgi:WS/DGAT/MGAT family acyltransferase